jgi:hypothetical protein
LAGGWRKGRWCDARVFFQEVSIFPDPPGLEAAVNYGSRVADNFWFGFANPSIFAHVTGMVTTFFLIKLFFFPQGQQSF